MQAAVITAYKDYGMLHSLVQTLADEGIAIFLHIDKKADFSNWQIHELSRFCNSVLQDRAVYWGSYEHILSILDLLSLAIGHKGVTYVHIISGQDFPCGPVVGKFDESKIYMQVRSFAELEQMVVERIIYRNVAWRLDRIRWLYKPLNKILLWGQRALRIRRRGSRIYNDIYKGLVWLSMPISVAKFCLIDRRAQLFLRELRDFYVPEEYFFQTVLMNSLFADHIINNNRRFDVWDGGDRAIPAVLDMRDIESIDHSGCAFARKLDSASSADLLTALKSRRPPRLT